jgi:phage I-like protein
MNQLKALFSVYDLARESKIRITEEEAEDILQSMEYHKRQMEKKDGRTTKINRD